MKILVTGAAGAIGSLLSERLAKEEHAVVGIDAFTDYYDVRLKERNAESMQRAGVSLIRADLASADLAPYVRGAEIIFHLAAQPGISARVPFESYERNNVLATERLLEAVRDLPSLKLFVNIATSSVYGAYANSSEEAAPKPASFYGVTKLAAEQLVLAEGRTSDFPAMSLRLFSVYGERERPDKLYHKLIRAILNHEEFPLYEGSREHVRSYSYVGDILDGIMSVLDHQEECIGEIINLGTDVTHTTGEGIDIIEELLKEKANFTMKPPRPGDQKETAADIKKARKILSYDPKTTLHEGLQREVAWYQELQKSGFTA